ncbi:MAG: hypothetical protein ACUVV0_05965 [Anaerolineae bacterium]
MEKILAFMEKTKGLPVMLGIFLVVLNLILQFIPGLGFLATGNLLLHIGVVLALIGVLFMEAL